MERGTEDRWRTERQWATGRTRIHDAAVCAVPQHPTGEFPSIVLICKIIKHFTSNSGPHPQISMLLLKNECTGECTLNSNPPKAKAAVLNFNIEIWAVGRQRFLLSSVRLFNTSTEWKFLFRRNKLFVAKRIFGEVVVCCISARGVPLANILNYFLESGPYVYVQKASDLRCLLSMTASPRVEAAHRQHEAMSVSPVLP